jgi:lipopolysaccharide export LptBFGC system permease protein LptF
LLKTLHAYLLKDLLKVTMLTLVALTLLMSVLAIIQPLQKLGLAGRQLLELFIYTVPVMLSLTLPVATLFASTLVYGRFSQDNEMLAARASGISTLSMLRPALLVGAVVTVLSLAMINVVAPKLSSLASMVQDNIRQIFFHHLKSRGYADYSRGKERYVIHADSVDADANGLYGVVLVVQTAPLDKQRAVKQADKAGKQAGAPAVQQPRDAQPDAADKPLKRPGVTLAWSAFASLDFTRDPNGQDEVVVRALEAHVVAPGAGPGSLEPSSKMLEPQHLPIDNPIKEKTSFYTWTDLLETLRDPGRHSGVRREMGKISEGICSDMLAGEIVGAIRATGSFNRFVQGDERLEIEAAWAEAEKTGAALKSFRPDGTQGKLVTVIIRRGGKMIEDITARQGQVMLTWSRLTGKPQVTIKLDVDVTVNYLGVSPRRVSRAATWTRGELPLPEDILARASAIDLPDLYNSPEKLTSDPKVLGAIDRLKNKRIPQLRSDLIAELHVRVAYGASCFLMVAMGAALGLMFRGGQFISAFALSAVPAAAVIIMLLMGKAMVRNPASSDVLGLACIWGGIAALLVANLVIYARLARK